MSQYCEHRHKRFVVGIESYKCMDCGAIIPQANPTYAIQQESVKLNSPVSPIPITNIKERREDEEF